MNRMFNTRDVTKPVSGYVVCVNNYWMCEDGQPEKALFYGESGQYNSNESIVKRMLETNNLYKQYAGKLEIVFIPAAFIPNIYN